ncbi:MAG: glycosyltransferase family 4 protein [Gammaproteobacteria bacterium]|nr:glycosyltransferase family 4 protein [Gammaproteobacteria bacterium]
MGAQRSQSIYREFDVCIVGLKCWGFVSGASHPRFIGGIETDLVTLARTLAAAGKRVALIVYDEGQPEVTTINGITVFSSFSPDAGLPGLRFLFPRGSALIRAVRRVNATHFIQMGAGVESGWTALAVKSLGKRSRFIFFAGGDRDCLAVLPAIPQLRERLLYRLGLRLADHVVTQTTRQSDLLKQEFGIESSILRLPNSLQQEASTMPNEVDTGGAARKVLWVGRIDRNKRPHWLLELAETYPNYQFEVVGEANSEDNYSADFKAAALKADNIVLHGKIARRNLAGFYTTADLLCCTSEFEGFPATFLEAWSFGLPTISTVDPGDNITRFGAGATAQSLDELRDAIAPENLDLNIDRWSESARRLYSEEFSPETCLERFNQVLRKVA